MGCLLIVAALPLHLFAISGWQAVGAVSKVRPLPNGVEVKAGDTMLRAVALSPSVVHVRYAQHGAFRPDDSFAIVGNPGLSAPKIQVKDSAPAVEFDTGKFTVRILKSPMRVVFVAANGEVISEDAVGRPVAWVGTEFRVWKTMPEDEHYFGLGDKAGSLDHRNQAFTMWNTDAFGWQESSDPLYKTIPFFIALRHGQAYGIFLDNTYRSNFDFGKESRQMYSFGAEDGELNYYFFYGPHPKKVVEQYTALTGRPPLPPLFAFGYQQSRYSYYPEARVRELATEFRRRKIPADVIYLDIDYQDDNRPFTVDHKRFPHFEAMIRDLSLQGFKVVAITDPHLKREAGYRPYDEAMARNYLVHNPDHSVYVGKVWPGDSVFPDFARADVRAWWGTLYSNFISIGIRGFWNDMNEPAVFAYPWKTMPLDTVHNLEDRITNHREIHNVYGMENARATYEGLVRLRPNVRPFVLTRAAYAGAQRFAVTWTGDNSSTWNHLRMSLPMLLNLGVSGYSFAGADIGGFAGSPTPELLTRWMEVGAFNPLYRNHANKESAAREPWVHGPEHEAIRRSYIETRYRLLPYIYTNAEQTARTGVPLMRPMFMDFPEDIALATVDDEYMFGNDLLVAPKVVETLDPYNVRLPKGTWYDYWNGQKIEGGQAIRVNPSLDQVPVYVRAGAIIPQQPLVQTVDQTPEGPLEIRVYPGTDCFGTLYLDDGNTFDFKHGALLRTTFTCDLASGSIHVHIGPTTGDYKPWWHELRVIVMGIASSPKGLTINGTQVTDWQYIDNAVSITIQASTETIEMVLTN